MTTPTAREIARNISFYLHDEAELENQVIAALAAAHAAGMAEGIERAARCADAQEPASGTHPHYATDYAIGFSDAADQCAAAIRALCPTPGA